MTLLVDTHCWLWLTTSPERIGSRAMKKLKDERNELLLSAASAWEIAIKYWIGKLALPVELIRAVHQALCRFLPPNCYHGSWLKRRLRR